MKTKIEVVELLVVKNGPHDGMFLGWEETQKKKWDFANKCFTDEMEDVIRFEFEVIDDKGRHVKLPVDCKPYIRWDSKQSQFAKAIYALTNLNPLDWKALDDKAQDACLEEAMGKTYSLLVENSAKGFPQVKGIYPK